MTAARLRHSRLLVGRVAHSRLVPRPHAFAYRVWLLDLDLDELEELDRTSWLAGTRRWKPLRLDARDHLGATSAGGAAAATAGRLRAAALAALAAAGVTAPVDRMSLVAHARTFGHVFNPVSFVVCRHAGDGAPISVIADVHNTFGERHAYVLPAAGADGPGRWTAKKVFHVSPFFTLDGTYRFALRFAADAVDARIDLHRDGRPVFVSHLALAARPLTDAELGRALLFRPLMTLRVVAAIHWEALGLWRKRLPYHAKPPYDPRAASVTRP
ncbi:MAG: DUF1365 domain-containing protein [Vicinamibacterales bacterium]